MEVDSDSDGDSDGPPELQPGSSESEDDSDSGSDCEVIKPAQEQGRKYASDDDEFQDRDSIPKKRRLGQKSERKQPCGKRQKKKGNPPQSEQSPGGVTLAVGQQFESFESVSKHLSEFAGDSFKFVVYRKRKDHTVMYVCWRGRRRKKQGTGQRPKKTSKFARCKVQVTARKARTVLSGLAV